MQNFRNLQVWQIAHRFVLDLYPVTRTFPPDEQYGLTSQLRRAAVSVPTNLAEGCGRATDADFARFVQIAMGSASEVEYLLLLAHDLKYLTGSDYQNLAGEITRIKQMLSGLLKTLRTPRPTAQ